MLKSPSSTYSCRHRTQKLQCILMFGFRWHGRPRPHASRSHDRLNVSRKAKRGETISNPEPAGIEKQKASSANVTRIKKAAQDFKLQLLSEIRTSVMSHQQQGPAAVSPAASSAVKLKLANAIAVMQHGLVERESEVRLLLLAAMSGEHILLVGPPGTAKSEVGRRLNKLIRGTYFERLLTRFSVPEELFGPLSMRALEEDKYVRQTRGYLPEAEVAFIDEIFKANSAILNTLLTLINERQFDNGAQRVPVPLLSVVGASNELPESEELDALYDRFLVRKQVKQVSASGLTQLLTYYSSHDDDAAQRSLDSVAPEMLLSHEDIRRCREQAVATVRVPASVIQMVTDLRDYLQEKMEPPVYVSDRRLVKAVQLLQVAAFCNGCTAVTEYDTLLLQHVLWQKPEQADKISDWLMTHLTADDGTRQVTYLLSGVFKQACRSSGNAAKMSELHCDVARLRELLVDKYCFVALMLEGGFPALLDNLWLEEQEARAMATTLHPRLTKSLAAIDAALTDVAMLEVALRGGCDVATLSSVMPKHWADFIRHSDITDVRPLGTIPLLKP